MNGDAPAFDDTILVPILEAAFIAIGPEDREERLLAIAGRKAPRLVVAYPQDEDGYIRFEWGGRLLARVHISQMAWSAN